MRRTIELLPLLFTLVLCGCGPTALRSGDSSPRLSLGGEASRRIETLTDLEEVRGVVTYSGATFVATDSGLLRFLSAEVPGQLVEGLAGADVRGVVEDGEGLLLAVGARLAHFEAEELTPVEGVPNVGHITDMARTTDGTIWLCGLGGVARRAPEGEWEAYGEPIRCTTLAPTPEGQLWVGHHQGLWYVEGDVIREHPISGGMPEGYVRAVVPVLPGQILAVLQGPSDTKLGFYDGEDWYAYTVRGLDGQVIGLVRRGADVLLVSQDRVLAITPRGQGVPLVPIGKQTATVHSFRARTQSAADHVADDLPSLDVLEEPRRLAAVPDNLPTIQAPPFRARVLDDYDLPGRAYRAFVHGSEAYLAIANGGVMQLPRDRPPRLYRSQTLVPEEDLQIASSPGGTVWMLSREGHLAKYVNGRLRRVRLPEGNHAEAVAAGPAGAYLVTTVTGQPNMVRIFANAGRGWNQEAERTLALPTELVSVPFAGVSGDGRVWMALRVRREDGAGERVRGAAVIDPNSEAVIYHHRGADREAGGLPLPDEISAIDFDTENAWFASLSGLVRVGANQAVVFGEARGVRGEVVSDVVVGSNEIWLAAAEGLGRYDRSDFDFHHPEVVQAARPTRLAMDVSGHLYAASRNGLLFHEGEEWVQLDEDDGLPPGTLVDVETDSGGRVWLLTEDRVVVLEPTTYE